MTERIELSPAESDGGIALEPALDQLIHLMLRVMEDSAWRDRAAHLGPGGREPGAGRDPHLHLHGRDDGAQRHRPGPALLRAADPEGIRPYKHIRNKYLSGHKKTGEEEKNFFRGKQQNEELTLPSGKVMTATRETSNQSVIKQRRGQV